MEQSLVHGLTFAPSQHCTSSDFNPSDLIQTVLFNFFFINLGEIIVFYTKLYFRNQKMKKKYKTTCCIFIGAPLYTLMFSLNRAR